MAIPKGPLDYACKYIIRAVDENKFPPGCFLPSERELSELIGVTRTTLREAINILKIKGVLQVQHGKPTKVIKCIDECEEHY